MFGRATEGLELQKRNLRLFFGVIIGLCIFFAISYTGRLVERMQVEAEADQWEQRIAEARVRQAELAAQLNYVTSDEYVDQVAREDLGLALPGDSVVIVVPESADRPAPAFAASESAASDASSSGEPNLQAPPSNPSRVHRWFAHILEFVGVSSAP
jgi:cell division protein FtsB